MTAYSEAARESARQTYADQPDTLARVLAWMDSHTVEGDAVTASAKPAKAAKSTATAVAEAPETEYDSHPLAGLGQGEDHPDADILSRFDGVLPWQAQPDTELPELTNESMREALSGGRIDMEAVEKAWAENQDADLAARAGAGLITRSDGR